MKTINRTHKLFNRVSIRAVEAFRVETYVTGRKRVVEVEATRTGALAVHRRIRGIGARDEALVAKDYTVSTADGTARLHVDVSDGKAAVEFAIRAQLGADWRKFARALARANAADDEDTSRRALAPFVRAQLDATDDLRKLDPDVRVKFHDEKRWRKFLLCAH